MLLDPFEEQFHLPATAIELGDGQRRQGKVVRQKDQPSLLLGIEITNAPQFVRVASAGDGIGERDDLIAHNTSGSVDRSGVKALTIESFAGARDKEGRGQVQSV